MNHKYSIFFFFRRQSLLKDSWIENRFLLSLMLTKINWISCALSGEITTSVGKNDWPLSCPQSRRCLPFVYTHPFFKRFAPCVSPSIRIKRSPRLPFPERVSVTIINQRVSVCSWRDLPVLTYSRDRWVVNRSVCVAEHYLCYTAYPVSFTPPDSRPSRGRDLCAYLQLWSTPYSFTAFPSEDASLSFSLALPQWFTRQCQQHPGAVG